MQPPFSWVHICAAGDHKCTGPVPVARPGDGGGVRCIASAAAHTCRASSTARATASEEHSTNPKPCDSAAPPSPFRSVRRDTLADRSAPPAAAAALSKCLFSSGSPATRHSARWPLHNQTSIPDITVGVISIGEQPHRLPFISDQTPSWRHRSRRQLARCHMIVTPVGTMR